jgi:hypothetical protein
MIFFEDFILNPMWLVIYIICLFFVFYIRGIKISKKKEVVMEILGNFFWAFISMIFIGIVILIIISLFHPG